MNFRDKEFRKNVEIPYCSSNLYTILSESSSKLGDVLAKQAQVFRTEIYGSIKYESMNMINVLEAFDKLKTFQQEYFDSKASLFRKKERLFEEGNMHKWGLSSIPSSKPDKL